MTSELKMVTVPTEETLERFPGLVALQVIYENYVDGCTKCGLHEGRTKIVFGSGNTERPPIAFVGEAPGKEEDETGSPFVGPAGKLLTRMIEALGMTRDEVYILNSVACRPPRNRNPAKDEQAACWPIMAAQLRAVRPQAIVVLGGQAARSLLETSGPVGELRRKWWTWDGVPTRVTYHPAFLLRQESMKTRTWNDMLAVLERLGRKVPGS